MSGETLIDRNLLLLRRPDAKPSGPPAQSRPRRKPSPNALGDLRRRGHGQVA